MSKQITCAYSKCQKKFTPKSEKSLYCCTQHRVYGNREKNITGFIAFCNSIGADSSEVLDWLKVNYPKRGARAVNREEKTMWKQPPLGLDTSTLAKDRALSIKKKNKAKEIEKAVTKKKIEIDRAIAIEKEIPKLVATRARVTKNLEEPEKKEPPKTGGYNRRAAKLGF